MRARPDLRPAIAETHSAVVVFFGDHAYKLKKPVDLGFLDFTTREGREAVCHREVELNRRLSPDVYEGVADVLDPEGAVCDHLVVMRRMPDDRRLATLARGRHPLREELWDVAAQLAALHARSPRTARADAAAGVAATRARWVANTDALIEVDGNIFPDALVGAVHGLACRYLDGRAPLFEDRVRRGRAVDGHGDLLADDIFCLPDGPRILDCIEFDDDLRLGDGLLDAAFLAMDLEHLGRPELATHFLDAYRELRADSWPGSLAHHHIAYRAQVRAKVAAVRAQQGDPSGAGEARLLLGLAARHLEAGRVRLVLVGGLPGTGKSTLSEALAARTGWRVLRSDVIRKSLAPAELLSGQARRDDLYSAPWTTRTYAALLVRAGALLQMGESVILDASWQDAGWRQRARDLARATSSDLSELRCHAPADVALTRLAARNAAGVDPSDADARVAARMASTFAPWPEASTVPTGGSLERTLRAAAALLHGRPASATAAA